MAAGDDVFVAKYDPDGNHQWSRNVGGPFSDHGRALAVDGSDNVVVTGWFYGTADFGGGAFASAGFTDIFVASYDLATGAHRWSRAFGGGGSLIEEGRGVAVDGSGSVYLTGGFLQTANFGGSNLASAGEDDIVLAKYGYPPVSSPLSYDEARPAPAALHANRPNPLGPGTTISFTLPREMQVTVAIFNVHRKLVRRLYEGKSPAGHHAIEWDGTDVLCRPVSSGVYVYRLLAGDRALTRKMVVLR